MDAALNHRVLVLNRLWQPVNIVTLPRAFCLLFQEHAKVIHSETDNFRVMSSEEWLDFSITNPPPRDDQAIHTVRLAIRKPNVLLLSYFDKMPVQEVKFNRQNLFERDNYTCQYCGHSYSPRDLNLDHVIPRDRGGKTSWENIATSCKRCNSRKANRLPHEAGMKLLRKPTKPNWRPFVTVTPGMTVDESWAQFIQTAQIA